MKIASVLIALAGVVLPAAPAAAAPGVTKPATPPAAMTAASARAAAPATAAPAATTPGAPSPGTPAPATGAPAPAAATPGTPAPAATTASTGLVLVARYSFDGGAVDGRVADTSGHGGALTVRGADQGTVRFDGGAQGRYAAFPGLCAPAATVCPRGLLEAPDDAELNPGTRLFRWSARLNVTKAQIRGSSNVMQKGIAATSQWKLQIGATQGRAQCVVIGAGSTKAYLVRSAASVTDGAWHKVLCQRSGGTLAVYVDGVERGRTAIPPALSIANRMPLRIGGPNFNTRSDMYHGLLDDVYAELG